MDSPTEKPMGNCYKSLSYSNSTENYILDNNSTNKWKSVKQI